MSGIPASWGFIRDWRKCAGKTIEAVESTELGYGYTVSYAWTVLFTDGSRGFFIERPSEHTAIMPSLKAMEASRIFRPEELAEVVANNMRDRQEREKRREAEERRQFEVLQKKFATPLSPL